MEQINQNIVGPESAPQERLERAKRGLSIDGEHEQHGEPSEPPTKVQSYRSWKFPQTGEGLEKLLTAYGEYVAGGGNPVEVEPSSLDRSTAKGGLPPEQQLWWLIVMTPGFWAADDAIQWVYVHPGEGKPPIPGWKQALRDFKAALMKRLPFEPSMPADLACPASVPDEDLPNRKRHSRLLPGMTHDTETHK